MPFRLDLRLKLLEVRKKTKLKHLTPNFSPGFTLIELLVVIAIIGILASLATYSYTDSQKKSRDSRRKSDLTAIQKALELAKQDTAGSYSYPTCDTFNQNGDTGCLMNDPSTGATNGSTNADLIGASYSYIKAVPKDPKTGNDYIYVPTGTSNPCAVGGCTAFTLVACLENTKDPQKDDTDGSIMDRCGTFGESDNLVSYTVKNL